MKLERQEIGTVEILILQGPLADDDAEEFSGLLQQRLSEPNPRVAVSLRDVAYVDSAALNGLVAAADTLIDRVKRVGEIVGEYGMYD